MTTADRLVQVADTPDRAKPTYQLLALPPALLKHLTDSIASDTGSQEPIPLEIRGAGSDSAVLVTLNQTYSLRGVQNSNSLCVCSTASTSKRYLGAAHDSKSDSAEEPPAKRHKDEAVEIETVLHETLEVVPTVARLERLETLLRGTEFLGDDAEAVAGSVQFLTFDDLRSRLPASDAEIRTALVRLRVVTKDGFLRPLPPAYLRQLLPAVLSTLPLPAHLAHPDAARKKKGTADKGKGPEIRALAVEADEQDLIDALDAVECGDEDLARQVLGFFGTRDASGKRTKWALDATALIKELGIVIMAEGGFGQQPLAPLSDKWKSLAGGFAPVCDMGLLAGLHLFRPAPLSTVQYLPPARLSPDPATRFAELFTLQPRWLETEMSLFVDDLTGGDKKKRDALVLKFVRKVKEKDVTFWTARNLWA
ncbi:hypothetical protein BMF94_3773 [Rhodotorula taiwanensis]|uniref:Sister chromatid cohesion protein DCC1 n=1 Tax=Rhodotorula taiwanensis TaxID=741276 RepID=A0A2S5B9I2_9BASI|nr:hypothetical protein BMF94_3773 [Rhodotorula taiwanensis]